jgi:hypothetical protein
MADSTEHDELPGVSPLSLAERAGLADSILGLKLPHQVRRVGSEH